MIYALVPAAGKSTRMGRPKLELPLGDRTVIEHVVGVLKQAGIDRIVVVAGPHGGRVADLARQAGADVLTLPAETADMRATIEAGLQWIDARFAPDERDAWLLVPADHPTLDAGVVTEIVRCRQQRPEFAIFVPTHGGKRGHPTLIAWSHAARLKDYPPGMGLNSYLRGYASETIEVAVAAPEVLTDLDTPADYERLRHHFRAPKGQGRTAQG